MSHLVVKSDEISGDTLSSDVSYKWPTLNKVGYQNRMDHIFYWHPYASSKRFYVEIDNPQKLLNGGTLKSVVTLALTHL